MANQVKTVFLLGVLSVLFVAFGGLFGEQYLWMFGLMAIAMNFGAYFFSDKIVLAMHGAREVGRGERTGLRHMVEDLAMRAGLPTPRIFVIDSPQPNAFATGRSPQHGAIAFTSGILNSMSERELRGVAAHELGHIKNRDILITTIAATIASAIAYLANMAQWAAMFGGQRRDDDGDSSPMKALVLALVAPLAATVLQLAISRSREYLADESSARTTGDPEGLALALGHLESAAAVTEPAAASPALAALFIVNPFSGVGGTIANLFSTHPPIAERIARLRTMAGRSDWRSGVISPRRAAFG